MTNATVIDTLTAKISAKIEWAMRDLEMSYEDAKSLVRKTSTAGSAVWEAVDAKFS